MQPDQSMPDAIAMCSHPKGLYEHVPLGSVHNATCPGDCCCTPRVYVAVDALLTDAVVEAAWGAQSTDALTEDEEIRDVRILLRAAIAAATGEQP